MASFLFRFLFILYGKSIAANTLAAYPPKALIATKAERTSLETHLTHFFDKALLAYSKKVQRSSCSEEPKLFAKDDRKKIRRRRARGITKEVRKVS